VIEALALPPAAKQATVMAPPSSRRVPALMDELIEEILLRFPHDDPASLLSAALVCKSWCRLVSGTGFRRRFRELHRTPPMLGFLCIFGNSAGPFAHIRLQAAARFMPAATSFRRLPHAVVAPRWRAIDALHGRILFYDLDMVTRQSVELDFFVCNPIITGEVRRLPTLVPPDVYRWSAGLLGTAPDCNDSDHVDDYPFRVVVVSTEQSTGITFAYVYSSEQHTWSMQTSIQNIDVSRVGRHLSSRIGNNALYFRCYSDKFLCLEYNMTRRQLSVISLPSEWEYKWITFITAENGGLGIAMLEGYDLYTLSRGTGMDGQAVWGNKRVVSFSKLLPAVAGLQRMHVAAVVDVLGVILIGTEIGLFSIDIKSSKVTKLWEGNVGRRIGDIVPYVTFCTPRCTRLVLP
jgi:hypothetical protein